MFWLCVRFLRFWSCWYDCIRQLLIFRCTPMLIISHSTTSQRCFRIRRTDEGHWITLNSLSCSWKQIEISFALWQDNGALWDSGHEGMHMVSNNNRIDSGIHIHAVIDWKWWAKCVSGKHFPHHYTISISQPTDTRQGWVYKFMLYQIWALFPVCLSRNQDSSHQVFTSFQPYSFLQIFLNFHVLGILRYFSFQ